MFSSDKYFFFFIANNGSNLTAGSPAGSISAISQPLPLTHKTLYFLPSISLILVFTDVLPPPCKTNSLFFPKRRVV